MNVERVAVAKGCPHRLRKPHLVPRNGNKSIAALAPRCTTVAGLLSFQATDARRAGARLGAIAGALSTTWHLCCEFVMPNTSSLSSMLLGCITLPEEPRSIIAGSLNGSKRLEPAVIYCHVPIGMVTLSRPKTEVFWLQKWRVILGSTKWSHFYDDLLHLDFNYIYFSFF